MSKDKNIISFSKSPTLSVRTTSINEKSDGEDLPLYERLLYKPFNNNLLYSQASSDVKNIVQQKLHDNNFHIRSTSNNIYEIGGFKLNKPLTIPQAIYFSFLSIIDLILLIKFYDILFVNKIVFSIFILINFILIVLNSHILNYLKKKYSTQANMDNFLCRNISSEEVDFVYNIKDKILREKAKLLLYQLDDLREVSRINNDVELQNSNREKQQLLCEHIKKFVSEDKSNTSENELSSSIDKMLIVDDDNNIIPDKNFVQQSNWLNYPVANGLG